MCYGVEPELFPLDDQGYSALTTLAISEDDKSAALRGMTACPERAITVADEPHVRNPQATPKSGLTATPISNYKEARFREVQCSDPARVPGPLVD